jgi:exosortase K
MRLRRLPGAWLRPGVADLLTVTALLALVYVGKRGYAAAGVAELGWILAPTARLAGWLVGGHFELEADYGFVDPALRFAIVPACAGVNFLLSALGVLGAVLALGEPRPARRAGRLLMAGAHAYTTAIAANAVRIALAVAWHLRQPDLGWLTAARWHRIEGVAVYLLALIVVHELATAWRRRADTLRAAA